MLGVSYKAGVGDLRESPALKIMELLAALGATLSYHDPHVRRLPASTSTPSRSTRSWPAPTWR